MVRIEDLGETGYGLAVTVAEWWDNKRIGEGKIASKDVFKKASFYTYFGVGLIATLMSVFGWMRRWERWAEHMSHGFFYDLSRQVYGLYKSQSTSSRSEAAAVREAQRVINEMKSREARLLAEGKKTGRSYQEEFESVTQAF